MAFETLVNHAHLTPHGTEQEVGLTYAFEACHADKKREPRGFSLGRRERAAKARATWALLLSVVAVLALLVGCFRARRLGLSAAGAARRLAGGLSGDEEDSEESALLEACLDLEEEAGLIQQMMVPLPDKKQAISRILEDLSGHGPEAASQRARISTPSPSPEASAPVQSPLPGLSRPPAGQKRVFSGPPTGSPTFTAGCTEEFAAAEQSPAKKHISGWKSRKLVQSSPSSSSFVEPPAQVGAADAPGDNPFPKSILEAPLDWSPKALDVTEFVGEVPQQIVREEHESSPLFEALDSASAVRQIPVLMWSPLGQLAAAGETLSPLPAASTGSPRPSTSHGPDQPLAALLEDILPRRQGLAPATAFSAAPPPSGGGRGSTQSASLSALPGPAPQMHPNTHLFYRIPTLLPGVVPRNFNTAFAFSSINLGARALMQLTEARALLAQPELTAADAELLVTNCEILAGRTCSELQMPTNRNPAIAVERLGRVFLFLDVLFCSIQVIGPAMNAELWWPQLTGLIQPPCVITSRHPGVRAERNAGLATQLSAALQSFKDGVRPGKEETVRIKRALLCSTNAVAYFKDKKWDPWRNDDKISRGSAAR